MDGTQITQIGVINIHNAEALAVAQIGGYRALAPRPTVTLRNDSRRLPEPHVRCFLIDLSQATFRRQVI